MCAHSSQGDVVPIRIHSYSAFHCFVHGPHFTQDPTIALDYTHSPTSYSVVSASAPSALAVINT